MTYLQLAVGSSVAVDQVPPNLIFESLLTDAVDSAYLLEPQVTLALRQNVGQVVCWSPLSKLVRNPTIVASHAINPQSAKNRGWTPADIQGPLATAATQIRGEDSVAREALAAFTELPPEVLATVGLPEWLVPSAATLPHLIATCNLLRDAQVVDSCNELHQTQIVTSEY